jgi:hypothetical protein
MGFRWATNWKLWLLFLSENKNRYFCRDASSDSDEKDQKDTQNEEMMEPQAAEEPERNVDSKKENFYQSWNQTPDGWTKATLKQKLRRRWESTNCETVGEWK